ncbi:MAG: GTP-binding protein [Candidatus Baldrarchaeia archaeon]
MSQIHIACKIVLIGDGGCGKTTLRKKFMGESLHEEYIPTLGVDFSIKRITIGNRAMITFQIWDLAGQPHFKEVRAPFYKGARGAMVVYDVSNLASFRNVPLWVMELLKNCGYKVPIVLVANKIDLRDKVFPHITTELGMELAKELENILELPVPYIETCAIRGDNVDKAFYKLARMIIEVELRKKKGVLDAKTTSEGQKH